MTKTLLLTQAVLALLALSSCSAQAPQATESVGAASKPGADTGVTVFGDARLGVVMD